MAVTRGLDTVDVEFIELDNYTRDTGQEAARYLEEHDVPYDEGMTGIVDGDDRSPTLRVYTENKAVLTYTGLTEIESAAEWLAANKYATDR